MMRFSPDHPRSRGVYSSKKARRRESRGSSPLARGLPRHHGRSRRRRRIIPARAGFTENVPRTFSVRGDHPRSRGVYNSSTTSGTKHAGSSPLARGLLINSLLRRNRRRIIPARAGFTQSENARD